MDDTSSFGWSPADSLGAIALSEANAWRQAADLCAARIRDSPVTAQSDARLLLLALRQFLKAARLAERAVADLPDTRQALAAACGRFATVLPGAKDACDMIEHFAEYAEGTGDLQHPAQRNRRRRVPDRDAATRDWPLGYDPGTDVITLGQHQVGVTAACRQVKVLQHAIWSAVRDQ